MSKSVANVLCAIALVSGLIATQSHAQKPPTPSAMGKWPFTEEQWFEARGVYPRYELEGSETIVFTYGSPQLRKMSYEEFEAFVRAHILDQTLVHAASPFLPVRVDTAKPGDTWVTAVSYVSPDGRLARWDQLRRKPVIGRWSLMRMPDAPVGPRVPDLLMCMDFPGEPGFDDPSRRNVRESCRTAYTAIHDIHGSRPGDVFDLMSGKEQPTYLEMTRPVWPDGQLLVAEKAPHD